MTSNSWAHPALAVEFARWRRQNEIGGWRCWWRRRPTWVSQILQRMGCHLEVSAPLFWGERMRIVTGENVSRNILTFGYAEAAITALMLRILRPGQTVVDVGTHFGYEALLAAQLVGRGGRVIAFEPNPKARALALRNLSGYSQADVHGSAVGDREGMWFLEDRPIAESAFNALAEGVSAVPVISVPITTLDRILADRTNPVHFVKCDAEGAELAVLRGAHEVLSTDAPLLVLEADMPSVAGSPSERAYEQARHLEPYGYRAFSFDFDGAFRMRPLGELPVFHANVAFVPESRTDLLGSLLKG